MQASVDRFGRIVIPKRVRDDLGLRPGSVLRVEQREGEVCLVPLEEEPGLTVKEGVLVYGGQARGDLEAAVAEVRQERLDKLAGRDRR